MLIFKFKPVIDKRRGPEMYALDTEQAVQIVSVVYDWEVSTVLDKKASSLQHWLTAAGRSDKLTARKLRIVEDIVYRKHQDSDSLFKRILERLGFS